MKPTTFETASRTSCFFRVALFLLAMATAVARADEVPDATALEEIVASHTDAITRDISDLRNITERDLRQQQNSLTALSAQMDALANRFGSDEFRTLAQFLLGGIVLLLVLQIILVFSQFWAARRRGAVDLGPVHEQMRQLEEKLAVLPSMHRAVGGSKPDGAPDRLRKAADSLSATADEVGVALSRFLEEIVEVGKTLRTRTEPVLAQMDERARELESRAEQARASEASLREEAERLESKRSELDARLSAEGEASGRIDALLPASLRTGGRLAAAQKPLVAALATDSSEARRFLRALAEWEDPTAHQPEEGGAGTPELVFTLGVRGHAFLNKHLPTEEEAHLEIAEALLKHVREETARLCPHIEVKPVFPGDRFDTDRMESVGSGSGNRLTVRQALSWLILDRSGDQTKILHRARVIAD